MTSSPHHTPIPLTVTTTPPGPATAASRLEPGAIVGEWQIEAMIGLGGMGAVYEAVHTVIGKRVALKVVRADLCASRDTAERFVQEARVVNQIGHPNIVDIFQIGTLEDGRPYLAMELLRGSTLGARMAAGRIAPGQACDLLLQVCAALAAAHSRGVVHRDLKPDNIVLVDDRRESVGGGGPAGAAGGAGSGAPHGLDARDGTVVKLVDWGIAKLMDAAPSTEMTATGQLVGTPQYMSPEQARGKPVDGRTDIYALGTIAYELFLEGPPFSADNVADLITMHLRETAPPPSDLWPDIPPELERLLTAMLAKAPGDRPDLERVVSTLRAVREQLDARTRWASERPVGARVPSTTPPPRPTPSSRRARPLDASLDQITTWDEPSQVVATPPPPRHAGSRGRAPRARAASQAPLPRLRRHLGRGLGAVVAFVALGAVGAAVSELARDPARLAGDARAARLEPRGAVPDVEVPAAPAGADLDLDLDLADDLLAGPDAALDLRVIPADASISIDGTPARAIDGRLVAEVDLGSVTLVVEAPGYEPYRRELAIEPGTFLLEVTLRPRARRQAAPASRPPASRRATRPDLDGTIDPFR
jgi:serine/threonine protein kinase